MFWKFFFLKITSYEVYGTRRIFGDILDLWSRKKRSLSEERSSGWLVVNDGEQSTRVLDRYVWSIACSIGAHYYYYYYYFFLFVFSLSRIALTIDLSLNYCPLFMLDNKNDFSCVRVIVDPRYSSIFLFFFFRLIEIFWCSSFLHLFKRKIAFKKNLWINWFVHGKK